MFPCDKRWQRRKPYKGPEDNLLEIDPTVAKAIIHAAHGCADQQDDADDGKFTYTGFNAYDKFACWAADSMFPDHSEDYVGILSAGLDEVKRGIEEQLEGERDWDWQDVDPAEAAERLVEFAYDALAEVVHVYVQMEAVKLFHHGIVPGYERYKSTKAEVLEWLKATTLTGDESVTTLCNQYRQAKGIDRF